jgi:hypothetical protein
MFFDKLIVLFDLSKKSTFVLPVDREEALVLVECHEAGDRGRTGASAES